MPRNFIGFSWIRENFRWISDNFMDFGGLKSGFRWVSVVSNRVFRGLKSGFRWIFSSLKNEKDFQVGFQVDFRGTVPNRFWRVIFRVWGVKMKVGELAKRGGYDQSPVSELANSRSYGSFLVRKILKTPYVFYLFS